MKHWASAFENIFFIGGAAYLIQVHGWSGWTMVLAILLCSCSTVNKDKF